MLLLMRVLLIAITATADVGDDHVVFVVGVDLLMLLLVIMPLRLVFCLCRCCFVVGVGDGVMCR